MKHLIVLTAVCYMTFFFFNEVDAGQVKVQLVIGIPEEIPYASEDLPNGGLNPELIKEIFHRMECDIKIKFLPFKRIILMLEKGTLTGAAQVSYKEDRTRFLIYPENELYADTIKVFGLKNGKILEKYTGLKDLRGSTVGTFRGGFIESDLAAIQVKYESANTTKQNIKKL